MNTFNNYQIGVVHRNISRLTNEKISELSEYGVATISESMSRTGLMKPYMRPIYSPSYVCGSVVTVLLHPGDNWMLHVVAEQVREGDVVVAALTSECSDGFFGDLLATSFKARGAAGLIIDAGVRDVAEITKMQFPVWSKCISAKGTIKATIGSVNIPVVCAGALVTPGDIVVADDDGIVLIPQSMLEAVTEKATQRTLNEETKRIKLASGVLGLDMYEMRGDLQKAGLKYID